MSEALGCQNEYKYINIHNIIKTTKKIKIGQGEGKDDLNTSPSVKTRFVSLDLVHARFRSTTRILKLPVGEMSIFGIIER